MTSPDATTPATDNAADASNTNGASPSLIIVLFTVFSMSIAGVSGNIDMNTHQLTALLVIAVIVALCGATLGITAAIARR